MQEIENDYALYNVIRKGIGEILTKRIEELGFKKVGSGGGIGVFALPETFLGKSQKFEYQNANISRAIQLSIIFSSSNGKWYLSADIKGRYEEKITLKSRLLTSNLQSLTIDKWPSSERIWQIELNDLGNKILPKEVEQEYFEILELKEWNDITSMEVGYGKYANRTWLKLLELNILSNNIEKNLFIIVKAQGRVIKDPNRKIVFLQMFK